MIRHLAVVTIYILLQVSLQAQGNLFDEMKGHEAKLNAETKQINQFIRRFNGEEDTQGNRYYEGDRGFRDRRLRLEYLPFLFDQNAFNDPSRETFINQVTDRKSPLFLDFHDNDWFAEVYTEFLYKGQPSSIILLMKIQTQGMGYEWVIDDVIFGSFQKMFFKDTTASKPFMHPMSHELDFMNLRKAFADDVNPESFTIDGYRPDFVTLFIYELKKGNLKFKTVRNVKFHFFNIDGWYFELSKFNRSDLNSGWLISGLVQVNDDEKMQLKNFIYDK